MTANTLTAIFTGAIAALTFILWRSYKRIEWLTGALESHSLLMLRFTAATQKTPDGKPVRVIWWDPDEETLPPPAHGANASVETVRLYVPMRARKSWREAGRIGKFWRWLTSQI